MWLRVLLVAMLFVAVGLGGCKKKEPTPTEQAQQMQKQAEDTANDMKDQAEDTAKEAQDAANEAAE